MLRKDMRDFFDDNQTRRNEKWECERRGFLKCKRMRVGIKRE